MNYENLKHIQRINSQNRQCCIWLHTSYAHFVQMVLDFSSLVYQNPRKKEQRGKKSQLCKLGFQMVYSKIWVTSKMQFSSISWELGSLQMPIGSPERSRVKTGDLQASWVQLQDQVDSSTGRAYFPTCSLPAPLLTAGRQLSSYIRL